MTGRTAVALFLVGAVAGAMFGGIMVWALGAHRVQVGADAAGYVAAHARGYREGLAAALKSARE